MTLVFPALGSAAEDYLRSAKQRGETLICASSVRNSDFSSEFGPLHYLPSINESDFAEKFLALIEAQGISHAFCPVSTVYSFVEGLIAHRNLDVHLIGKSPVQLQIDQHHLLMNKARRLLPFAETCAGRDSQLTPIEMAGVMRFSSLIYGESNEDKLAAMMGIFASAPAGDVIEIGSLMGRSASVLIYLAWRYQVGPILTIDPWSAMECIQRESPDALQAVTDSWDYEVLREAFFVNMVPLRPDDHAHLRLPAAEAFSVYANGDPIKSALDQCIVYARRIAVIHIDGNHDYDCVKNDCELWLGRMVPGAWLILDDYIWAHGDGPYRAGNELLRDQPARIERAFVCGKALFVKLKH